MDRDLTRLQRLDWSRIEVAEQVAGQVTDLISTPGALRELMDNALDDATLLNLSERQWWGDRIVLFDDPDSMLRIRLHRFDQGTHFPHSHRWPFHTRILKGQYLHRFYGPEAVVRAQLEASPGSLIPSMVRNEGAGSSYAIDQHMVHSVTSASNTFSLVIQGPRLKAQSLRTAQDGSIIWKGGRATEATSVVREVEMPKDRLLEVREVALRSGLLDR
ncbi:hypothetical protein AB0D08_00990 [Kitasatospora sp. NPDC048540]|uniref:hypothetical protein n=1 Tax=unclassified Kitasatospora TaxID=2633591 RepID=UPI00068CB814|nr:hypothetical protein [Kitasatospora sp. MBT63]